MKVAVFSTHSFERGPFQAQNASHGHDLTYFDTRLSEQTASLARGFDAVAVFVSDTLNAAVLEILKTQGTRIIALRSAGFNHVDLEAAARLEMPVVRVPEYSPYAVAEHAVTLLLALNRKICRAYNRVRESNFSLDGLVGFDLHGKTVGVVGTGKIGTVFARIMRGFGCRVLAYDIKPDAELAREGVEYVELPKLYAESHVISLHLPLTPGSRHLVGEKAFASMRPGAFLINTSRGGLVDTGALVSALKSGRLGAAGLDVYEEEEGIFFEDLSNQVLQDDVLARLLTFPNVLVTSHQGFLTGEALHNIARTTLENLTVFDKKGALLNEVHMETHRAP